jgi:hypothetical protein
MYQQYKDSYITKYQSPFTAYLADQHADEDAGDIESPFGWFARLGRYILTEDDRGFLSHQRFASVDEAQGVFEAMAIEFYAWANGCEEEELYGDAEEELPRIPGHYRCAACGLERRDMNPANDPPAVDGLWCPVLTDEHMWREPGGLADEVRDAELWAPGADERGWPTFELTITETTVTVVHIQAASESAARQAFIDEDLTDLEETDVEGISQTTNYELTSVQLVEGE